MRLPFDGAGLSCVRYRCLCEAHIRDVKCVRPSGRDLGPRAASRLERGVSRRCTFSPRRAKETVT